MKLFRIGIVVLMMLVSALTVSACAIKPPVEDFAWVLTMYGSPGKFQDALATPQVTAYFSSKDNTLKGSTGVNTYGGTFQLDGMTLTISNLTSTLVGSANPALSAQESTYLSILNKADRYEMDHGSLIIHSGNNQLIFKLGDITLKQVNHWGEEFNLKF
jgi:heat shock protein HslJ